LHDNESLLNYSHSITGGGGCRIIGNNRDNKHIQINGIILLTINHNCGIDCGWS